MASVRLRTVLGDVDPETMGATLPHEHLLLGEDCWWRPGTDKMAATRKDSAPTLEILWHWLENPTINRGNLHLDSEADAIAEVRDLPALGVGTLLELTNVGLRPNHEGYRRIARATGLNVVAGCGYYIADSLSEQSNCQMLWIWQ